MYVTLTFCLGPNFRSSYPLPTLVIEAQHSTDSLVNSSASTKFKHDAIDVPFSRSFISKETLKQQDVQRIDDALSQVSGVYSQTNYGGGFGITFLFEVSVPTLILVLKSFEMD